MFYPSYTLRLIASADGGMRTFVVREGKACPYGELSVEIPSISKSIATAEYSAIAKAILAVRRVPRTRPRIRCSHVLGIHERGISSFTMKNAFTHGIFIDGLRVNAVVYEPGICANVVGERGQTN